MTFRFEVCPVCLVRVAGGAGGFLRGCWRARALVVGWVRGLRARAGLQSAHALHHLRMPTSGVRLNSFETSLAGWGLSWANISPVHGWPGNGLTLLDTGSNFSAVQLS